MITQDYLPSTHNAAVTDPGGSIVLSHGSIVVWLNTPWPRDVTTCPQIPGVNPAHLVWGFGIDLAPTNFQESKLWPLCCRCSESHFTTCARRSTWAFSKFFVEHTTWKLLTSRQFFGSSDFSWSSQCNRRVLFVDCQIHFSFHWISLTFFPNFQKDLLWTQLQFLWQVTTLFLQLQAFQVPVLELKSLLQQQLRSSCPTKRQPTETADAVPSTDKDKMRNNTRHHA